MKPFEVTVSQVTEYKITVPAEDEDDACRKGELIVYEYMLGPDGSDYANEILEEEYIAAEATRCEAQE